MLRLSASVLGVLLLALVGLAQSATLRNSEEAKELAEKVLGRATVDDFDGLMTALKAHWLFPENELEALVAQLTQQRSVLANRVGKSMGFVLVRREMATDVMLRLTYLERFENTGLRWMFLFYKVRDVWKFQSLVCDDDLTKLFPSTN